MKINFGFIISKLLRVINRPALRDCKCDKKAAIGSGSNCINMSIGRYSYMGKNNSVCNADIGAFCSIASYCAIGGGNHPTEFVSTSPIFQSGHNIFGVNFSQSPNTHQKRVAIGNDVWIGEKVFIRDGINIGDGAIIGAHSVVTKDVPPYAIVAGSPARLIRYRFDEAERELLLASRWWEWPEEQLLKMGDSFISVAAFSKKIEQLKAGK